MNVVAMGDSATNPRTFSERGGAYATHRAEQRLGWMTLITFPALGW